MALISCPECGKQVSDQAASCPGCGCPVKHEVSNERSIANNDKKVKIWIISGIFVLIAIVIFSVYLKEVISRENYIRNFRAAAENISMAYDHLRTSALEMKNIPDDDVYKFIEKWKIESSESFEMAEQSMAAADTSIEKLKKTPDNYKKSQKALVSYADSVKNLLDYFLEFEFSTDSVKGLLQAIAKYEAAAEYFNETVPDEINPFAAIAESSSLDIVQQTTTFEVDWEKALEDTRDNFNNRYAFPYVKLMNVFMDEEQKSIHFRAMLYSDTKAQTALLFADAMVAYFNTMCMMQDSSIAPSEGDYFGGIYDVYDIYISVMSEDNIDDTDTYFVYSELKHGERNRKQLQLQKAYS